MKQKQDSQTPPRKSRKVCFLLRLTTGKEREYFLENFSMLLEAGIDPITGLKSLKKEFRTKGMKRVSDGLIRDIESGYPIWQAMRDTCLFDKYAISLLKLGEKSGRLTENLKIIVRQQQKQKQLKSKIRSGMMYPVLVLALALIVGIGIAWFILPKLTRVFSSLDMELPLITRVLIATGNYLSDYGAIIIPLFLLTLTAIFYFVFFFSKTKFLGQNILLRLPVIKNLVKEVELSRFGYILSNLLKAGMPLDQSLEALHDATTFTPYKKMFGQFIKGVNQGDSLERIFEKNPKSKKLMSASIQQMIASGERSGSLGQILAKIGKIQEEKTDNTSKNLSVLLEPLLLVVVWLGVVGIALAVILPIYSLVGGLNSPGTSTSGTAPATSPPEIPSTPEEPSKEDPSTTATSTEEIATGTPAVATSTEKTATSTEGGKLQRDQLQILPTGIGYLNVRNQPGTYGTIIDRAEPGETYEYTDQDNGWYEIVLEQGTGWVYGEYIEIIE
jgi:type II secretory pathway component PulF